jgi:methylphosphotriester-DNA--protein-cysteine methyltransferase
MENLMQGAMDPDVLNREAGHLAKSCGISESYLSRTFHRQIGVPLSQYRNTLRLSLFWEEFKAPAQKTVAEAVYSAGFGSYGRFYRVFTQTNGRDPRECLADTIRPS